MAFRPLAGSWQKTTCSWPSNSLCSKTDMTPSGKAPVREACFLAPLSNLGFPTQIFNRNRSEEHTSELQSLMRISYAVFCLKKKNKHIQHDDRVQIQIIQ